MRRVILVLFSYFFISQAFAQKEFTLVGKTTFTSNGKAILRKNAPVGFYTINIINDTVKVHNNSFQYKGFINSAEQFRITIFNDNEKNYITEPFFLNEGSQEILIDTLSSKNNPFDFGFKVTMQKSESDSEYVYDYLLPFINLNKRINIYNSDVDSCNNISTPEIKKNCLIKTNNDRSNIRNTRDSILLSYALAHDKSQILPWILYEYLRRYGYRSKYLDIYTVISKNISPDLNKALKEYIKIQKDKSIGSYFPLVKFISSKINPDYLVKNKYTLVEFWFSGCAPCIAQFNSLKPIYRKYNAKGFDIVAISIDKVESKNIYRKLIKINQYKWKQIWDIDGSKTNSIGVDKFPTSFLLNSIGQIVDIDIKPEGLDEFLSGKLQIISP